MRSPSVLPWAMVLAAVVYSGWPLELLVHSPLDPTRSYLSENAALTQPHSALFRTFDVVAAVLVLVCVAGTRNWARWSRWWRAAAALLAVFAVSTVVDAAFPLRCAPSLNPRCSAAQAEGSLGIGHSVHSVASSVALGAVVLSALASAVALARSPARRRARVPVRVSTVLAAVLVLISVVMTAAALADSHPMGLPAGAGVVQRVQTVLIAVYLGAWLWFARRVSESPRP
ncbi:DUF998 domain-containing protein [Rhodococcoides corynebacterioides]|uniref:DUF998 domain-containing protein n=1 Tax=Rhodococcoides corynebacterioides TaxID=53972 RepID=UPI003F81AC21